MLSMSHMDHDQHQTSEMTPAEAAEMIAQRLDEHEARLSALASQFAGLQQVRNDLQDLRAEVEGAAAVSPGGLAAAIAAIAADGQTASAHERAIARAAHEVATVALASVPRHGDVTSAGVGIRHEDGWLTVVVSDNGSGGSADQDERTLEHLRQRVRALHGHLTRTGTLGESTAVLVGLPRERTG